MMKYHRGQAVSHGSFNASGYLWLDEPTLLLGGTLFFAWDADLHAPVLAGLLSSCRVLLSNSKAGGFLSLLAGDEGCG